MISTFENLDVKIKNKNGPLEIMTNNDNPKGVKNNSGANIKQKPQMILNINIKNIDLIDIKKSVSC